MRFITEFEFDPFSNNRNHYNEGEAFKMLGYSISKSFGFKENKDKRSLEIEAFPMEKWIEFKQKLFTHVYEEGRQGVAFNQVRILELIKELESFGKPAGDTVTNKQLTNGTE